MLMYKKIFRLAKNLVRLAEISLLNLIKGKMPCRMNLMIKNAKHERKNYPKKNGIPSKYLQVIDKSSTKIICRMLNL